MRMWVLSCSLVLLAAHAKAIDLSKAVVVASADSKAAAMLVDEVEKRTRIRLPLAAALPASGAAIVVGQPPAALANRLRTAVAGADGYRVQVIDGSVVIAGNDARGTLFGVGALLRNLRLERDRVEAP